MAVLQTLAHEKNVAIIVTLHELELAQKLADAGRLRFATGVSSVLRPKGVRRKISATCSTFRTSSTLPCLAKSLNQNLSITSAAGKKTAALRLHHRHLRSAGGGGGGPSAADRPHARKRRPAYPHKGIVVEVAPQFCRRTATRRVRHCRWRR